MLLKEEKLPIQCLRGVIATDLLANASVGHVPIFIWFLGGGGRGRGHNFRGAFNLTPQPVKPA
jgi:hypothetical protein